MVKREGALKATATEVGVASICISIEARLSMLRNGICGTSLFNIEIIGLMPVKIGDGIIQPW